MLFNTVPIWLLFLVPNCFRPAGLVHSARSHHVCVSLGFRLHLHCVLDRGWSSLPNLAPETVDVPSSNGPIESTLLFKGLFQRRAPDFGSHRFLCKLCNCEILDLLLNSLELLLRHLFFVGQLESTSVSGSNLRLLDCFVSPPLGLWDLSLHRHAIVNNLVDELRLGNSTVFCISRAVGTCLCVLMWGQLH